MNQIAKIKLEIIFWSCVFNPGAAMLGLGVYKLKFPESSFPSFLVSPAHTYAFIAVGVALSILGGWRVFNLSNKQKRLAGENT